MSEEATQDELKALRAEVAMLRQALASSQTRVDRRGLFDIDPEAPGLKGLWRGERGVVWQLFVQGVVAVNVGLAVVAGLAIIH